MDDVLTLRAHGPRLLLAAALVVALFAGAASSARAADAVLWACHGPDGRALGDGGLVATALGDATTAPYGAGCAAPGTASGGLRASAGAAWRASVPAGLTLRGVTVTRRALDDAYALSDGAGVLESGALGDGTVTFGASGAEVRAGAVDLSALALRVSDDAAPRGAVGGLVSPAAGVATLAVRASDAGTGVASATLVVDGAGVATSAICDGELTPGDGEVDLALGGAPCPESADAALTLDTTRYADGEHRVQVVVRDVAGNATLVADQAVFVRNTPVTTTTSVTVGVGSGDGAGSSDGVGGSGGGTGAGGSTGGASSGGGTGAVACAKPQLSMLLAQKPLRTVKGRPVLKRGHRYRFTGRLTCLRARDGKRVSAARGTKIELLNVIGKRTVGKSGTTVRTGGKITILLSYPSSRTIEFRYRSADGSASRVKIPVTVVRR